jgi:trk system potassium uptake protein TrkA
MRVVIAGGGRTAAQLAALLVGQNHTVRLVEHRPDILARIHRELPPEAIHEGDATDPVVLEAAGAREAQVLAACTPDDADNLALCFFARTQLGAAHDRRSTTRPRPGYSIRRSGSMSP